MESAVCFAVIGWIEIFGLLAIVLVCWLGADLVPPFARGFHRGLHNFSNATSDVVDELQPKQGELVHEALTHDSRTAEFVYPERNELHVSLRNMILLLAQGFGSGRIPIAPGTFGSLVGLAWFIALLATRRIEFYLAGTIAGVALSIWICGAAEKILRQKDPGSIVLDEIVALPVVFLPWLAFTMARGGSLPQMDWLLTGRGLLTMAVGFGLFRLFDIWKPWPVRQIQNLPGGWGVTADDVLAAIYAGLGVWLLNAL